MNYFPSNVNLLSTPRYIYGGTGSGNFENFNLALHVNDSKDNVLDCLLYTSPSPRDVEESRMPSSA